MLHRSQPPSVIVARLLGTSTAVEVRFGDSIESIDELIYPPDDCPFVAPGFVDLQVNGFAGVDYNDPASPAESIATSIRTMFRTGVTRFLATIITGPEERIAASLQNLATAKEQFIASKIPEAEALAGFHVEGPHISPEDGPRGAHPREHIRPPDIDEFDRWQTAARGDIKLVTVSPEWETAPAYIRHLVRAGVVASIGHTKATCDQIQAAVEAGATMSTHLGNAAHAVLPKTQNYIWDQLAESALSACFIADGIHIPAAFFSAALRAKGPEHSILVTDAVMPAMCQPGPYRLGQLDVELRGDDRVVMRGGDRLAGSSLRMDRAIGNAVRFAKMPLRDAIAMATINPSRVGRIGGRQRGLSRGERADLVSFRWNDERGELTVLETIVSGSVVYRNSGDAGVCSSSVRAV